MTREEIIKKIESFGGRELTKDELYEIGVMHRELPLSQRDWTWAAEMAGWKSSAESYRGYIKHRMKKDNTLPVATSVNAIEGANESELTQQKHEIFKERQKLRDERTNLNRLLRDESRVERFLEALQDEARAINNEFPLKPVCYIKPTEDTKAEAVALLSDVHLGMQIDEYCNKYDATIAEHRLDHWVNEVIKYCVANKVRRLNVVNLGDLIHGEIHPSLRVDQQMDVASQVIKAGELLARALARLQEAAPEVYYRSVSDNHARFLPDKNQSIERENFFRLIDNWLEVRLENTNIKMPKDNINFRTGKFRLMNGKLCMFEHGHCLKPNQSFQSLIGMVEEYVHFVFLAHYHEEKMKTYQNMRVFINGSLCGTDPYADSIHKYSKPKQTLLIFDADNLLNISIDLDIRE